MLILPVLTSLNLLTPHYPIDANSHDTLRHAGSLELRAKNHDLFAKQLSFKWKFELSTIFKLSSLRIRSIKCLRIRALALCYVGEQINAVLVCAERLSVIRRFLLGISHCDLSCC